jgi:hypothetical protein
LTLNSDYGKVVRVMAMQLNIYVPKSRAGVVADLERVSRETGRQKNEIVLEALARFLAAHGPEIPTFHLGSVKSWKRGDLYQDRLDRVVRRRRR